MHTYTLRLSKDRLFSLSQDGRALPVSEPALWHMAAERGFDFLAGEERVVDVEFAKEAIEEALGRVASDIAEAELSKKQLIAAFISADGEAQQAAQAA